MKKFNLKLFLGSLILSTFILLIFNIIAFSLDVIPEAGNAFNNAVGINGDYDYKFNLTINLILLIPTTIMFYYIMKEEIEND